MTEGVIVILNGTTNGSGTTPGDDPGTSQILKVLGALSLAVIMICAITFNITALTTIIRVPSLRQKPHNLLLFNLAVADTSMALLVMPFSLNAILDDGEYLKGQRAACRMSAFIMRILTPSNVFTVIAIGFDRVLIVTSSKILPRGRLRVAVLITSIWLLSVASALPCNFGVSSCVDYQHPSRCCDVGFSSLDDVITIEAIVMLCITLPSLITSYSVIFVCLRRQAKKLKEPKRGPVISEPILTSALPSNPSGLRRVRFNMASLDNDEQVDIHDSTRSIPELTSANCIPGNSNEPSVAARGLLVGLLVRNGRKYQIGRDGRDDSPSVSTCGLNERGPDVGEETSGDNYCEDSVVSKGNPVERSTEPGQDKHSEISMTPRTKRKHVKRKALKRQYLAHRKVAMMGVMLVLAASVCYHPYVLVRLIDYFIKTWTTPDWLGVLTKWLSYSITVVDPLIYTFMNRRARKELDHYRSTLKKTFSRKQREKVVKEKINEKM
ncbi:uncharacterized protein [Diadema antillarum]|uniref:uncharacterized protein n=1 Tax=Diadema antillarum TaxID=105358 RepID=UPI003A871845